MNKQVQHVSGNEES